VSDATNASEFPTVSVIVPTRQRPELLRRALVAILGQRYEGAIEIVVVFDQEEPVDPEIEAGPGRSIRVMANARQPGLAGTRNTGILAATGDLIAHCDDDDEWLPDKVAMQVAALSGSESEVAVTGVTIVYGDRTIDRVFVDQQITLANLIGSRVQEAHPSSIMAERAAVVDGIGLVDEELPGGYGEDYEWLMRAARRHPILVVRRPLVRVYWHASSFFSDRWATIVEAIQYLLARYPEFQGSPLGQARLFGRMAFAYAAQGKRKEAREWARRTIRLNPRERRAYLALIVSTGLVSADALMRLAHRSGKGI
jgi:glycosyltransferase involved in cell wall biosynthesis